MDQDEMTRLIELLQAFVAGCALMLLVSLIMAQVAK